MMSILHKKPLSNPAFEAKRDEPYHAGRDRVMHVARHHPIDLDLGICIR